MATLTSVQFSMFGLMTSEATTNATSSPGSADGPLPSGLPDGATSGPSGPAPLPANPSRSPGSDVALKTSDTSPPNLRSWSGPSAPLCCLANRSQARTFSDLLQKAINRRLWDSRLGHGSMIYSTAWKQHDTPAGRAIFRLRASALRTSGSEPSSGLFGWPTASATDGERAGTGITEGMTGRSLTQMAAMLSGWSTASARDWKDGATDLPPREDGTERFDQLPRQAVLAGWNTPTAQSPNSLRGQGQDPIKRAEQGHTVNLTDQVNLLRWTVEDGPARITTSGQMLTGFSAGMNNGGQLSPAHSLWLMGYPAEWVSCGERAMRSIRGRRSPSSKPSAK